MHTTLQDLKYGLRMLTRAPAFAILAVLTLALGIGASTAVFSVVDAILLRPLPYRESERIVIPWRLAPPGMNLGYEEIPWGRNHFRLFRDGLKSFRDIGAYESASFNLTGLGEPALLEGLRVSAGFFPALGVPPTVGRTFTAAEDQPGHEQEVILSHQLWRDKFGADLGVAGRVMQLNGYSYTVIGVMPARFAFPRAAEMPGSFPFPREPQLWVPLALPPRGRNGPDELAVIGRLKPEVTVAQAQAEMNVYSRRLDAQFPQARGFFNSRVTPLARQLAGDTRTPLLLILGAVGVVLLIACSNVANLLLTRSLGRQREFSLRTALGAGHRRLIRQLLTENFILAGAAGVMGILLAEAAIRAVRILGPANIPRLQEVGLDLQVLAFALGVTLLTGMLFGLAPAIGATRRNLAESLKEAGQRFGGSPTGPRVRNTLLVSEVALALVLVIAAGLLVRTFLSMLSADAGFNAARVLTFELSLPGSKYTDLNRTVALYQRALPILQSLPGVQSAGIGETVPMSGGGESTVIRIPDQPAKDEKEQPVVAYTIASPGYFSAVGTPILRGRDIQETDVADAPRITVVNRAMATKFWPGQNPLGKQVFVGNLLPALTVTGVVADVKHLSLRESPGPEMYVAYTQKPWPSMLIMQVVLRTKADPTSVMASVRQAIRSIDPDLPVAKATTLTALVDDSIAQPRFSMYLVACFGGLAVLLASIGMYGVISYSVMQRTREIGLRMALGAERSQVFGMILGQGARLAGLGIIIGLLAALAVTRTMANFLYGVPPADPLTFVAVSLLLVCIALLACYLPAHRATRVDPMIALRYE